MLLYKGADCHSDQIVSVAGIPSTLIVRGHRKGLRLGRLIAGRRHIGVHLEQAQRGRAQVHEATLRNRRRIKEQVIRVVVGAKSLRIRGGTEGVGGNVMGRKVLLWGRVLFCLVPQYVLQKRVFNHFQVRFRNPGEERNAEKT